MKRKILSFLLTLVLALSLIGVSEKVSFAAQAADENHYLAFASDRHNNETAIKNTMSALPEGLEYVSLIGDAVGDKSVSRPTFNSSVVLNEFLALGYPRIKSKETVSLLWADHDTNVNDDAGIVFANAGTGSAVMYEGKNADGTTAYYVYGIGFREMKKKGQAEPAAKAFEAWVDTITDKTIPIIVCCHMPIHYARKDNKGGAAWNLALNYAATGKETTEADAIVKRNVIFLHGHNHTVESETGKYSGEFFVPCGSEMEVGKKKEKWSKIYYTYMTAGYLNQNDAATLLSIRADTITTSKYKDSKVVDDFYDTESKKSGIFANRYSTKGINEIARVPADENALPAWTKSDNPVLIQTKDSTVDAKAVKKKAQKIKASDIMKARNAKGSVTYEKVSGAKKIKINKSTGCFTVKKGLAKGVYKVTCKVIAAGNEYYNEGSVTATVKITVA